MDTPESAARAAHTPSGRRGLGGLGEPGGLGGPGEPLGLQQDDVVRLVSTGQLCLVGHVGGDTSEEDEETLGDEEAFEGFGGVPPWAGLAEGGEEGELIDQYDDGAGAGTDTDSEEEARIAAEAAAGVQEEGEEGEDADDEREDEPLHVPLHVHVDEHEEVPVGSARVLLLGALQEAVVPIGELRVEDRTFMTGDVVHRSLRYRAAAAAAGGERDADAGQEMSAIVTAVERRLTVRQAMPLARAQRDGEFESAPTWEVGAQDVAFLAELVEGCFVVYNDWLGRAMEVNNVLTVVFPTGGVCRVRAHPEVAFPADLQDETRMEEVDGLYYPGQYVRAQRPVVWEAAEWLRGGFRNEHVGRVTKIETLNLSVDWVATRCTDVHSPDEAQRPPEVVEAKDVHALDAFRDLSWRVGARGRLKGDLPDWIVGARGMGAGAQGAQGAEGAEGTSGEVAAGAGASAEAEEAVKVSDIDEDGEWVEVDGSDDEGEDGEWEEVQDDEEREVLDAALNSEFDAEWVEMGGTVESADHPPADAHPTQRRRRPPPAGGGRLLAAQRRVALTQMELEEGAAPGEHPSDSIVQVVNTRTFLDLMWQDGTESKRVPAVTVLRNNHLGQYDLFPGIFVSSMPDDLDEEAEDGDTTRKGVVVRVNPEDRTAIVRWQKPGASDYDDAEEEVSVYELKDHGEYDIRLTDTVLRVPQPGSGETLHNRPDWVGEVVGTGIGTARVAWHGGTVKDELPESLLVIVQQDEEDDEDEEAEGEIDEESYDGDEDDVMDASWEEDENTVNLPDNWAGEEGSEAVWTAGRNGPIRNVGGGTFDSTAVSALAGAMAAAAVGAGVLASPDERAYLNQAEPQNGVAESGSDADTTTDESAVVADAGSGDAAEGSTTEGGSGASAAGAEDEMERFEMMDSLANHHFDVGGAAGAAGAAPLAAGFAMVVRKEWTRLSRHLPAGIFVHGSESRLDVLRAAIVGPSGTPYEDVLFFFDIHLPPDYPTTPPKVHFMSHGRRMSPNLYETGKVCLSLLGTWDGDGVEKWDPRNSNLLRVLLSIQAMVLVEEPYYTEAGYEKQVGTEEGRANSLLYNESTLLLTLRHVVSTLRTGGAPPDFAAYARRHFAHTGARMLARCEALLSPAETPAAPAPSPGEPSSSSSARAPAPGAYASVGFKRSLQALVPRVRAALADARAKDAAS